MPEGSINPKIMWGKSKRRANSLASNKRSPRFDESVVKDCEWISSPRGQEIDFAPFHLFAKNPKLPSPPSFFRFPPFPVPLHHRPMLQIASALKKILLQKSVRTGTFTLASGKQSELYIDCRVTALDPFGALLIGDLGWHAVRSKIHSEHLKIDAIGGMTLGADPISLAVGMASATKNPEEALQVFTVRKEPKGHGAGKQIEGNFKSGDTVIVVCALNP